MVTIQASAALLWSPRKDPLRSTLQNLDIRIHDC